MRPAKAAAALVAASLGAGAWHILRNAAPPSFDDAWYLETSFHLFHALKRGLTPFASEYVSAFRIKAPLVSLVPLPLYALFGAGERTAVFASLVAHGAACAAVFAAGRALWPDHPRRDAIAALAAAITAIVPLLYGTSRYFLVEPVLTALVAAAAWRVATAREGRTPGVLLGFGLLAKIIFPLYLSGPIWLRRKELRPHIKTALFIAVPLAATWYAFNLPYVLGFAWSAGFGKIAADYGSTSAVPARIMSYAALLFGGALSWPLSASMLGVIAAAKARRERLDDGSRMALAWAAPLAIFAVGVNQEIRFAAPALPAFALLAARAAMSFDSRLARASAAAALLGCGTYVFIRQTFLVPPENALPWCGAPSSDPGWDRDALVTMASEGGAKPKSMTVCK